MNTRNIVTENALLHNQSLVEAFKKIIKAYDETMSHTKAESSFFRMFTANHKKNMNSSEVKHKVWSKVPGLQNRIIILTTEIKNHNSDIDLIGMNSLSMINQWKNSKVSNAHSQYLAHGLRYYSNILDINNDKVMQEIKQFIKENY